MTTTLVIANKLYSSWSMRPWLVLTELGIPFEEILIPLHRPETRADIQRYSPAGKVPALVDDGITVWDSLAIIEYAAERWPDAGIWPTGPKARAIARSISAEMHSGFSALRRGCPMNLAKTFAPRDRGTEVAANVARIEEIWSETRREFGVDGPFLFGAFSGADAMYAPVVSRFNTYGIAVGADANAYMQAIFDLPSFKLWRDAALLEPWHIDYGEADETTLADHRRAVSAA